VNAPGARRGRTYTVEQYRADVAALDALRHRDAPALRRLLDELVTADVDLVPPPASGVQPRRTTLIGGLVAPVDATALPPVTARVLRAVGLCRRPSARGGAR
jgi:hypothetical protein